MTHPLDYFKYCPKCGSKHFLEDVGSSKKCEVCGFHFFKAPAIGSAAFIFDEQDRMIVVRRAKNPAIGTLDLPGGFVDLGETIEQAIVREVKEEINIDVEVEKYLFCIPNTYVYSGFDVRPLDFFVKCKIKDIKQIGLADNENSEILFLEKDKINPKDFGLASVREAVEKFLAM